MIGIWLIPICALFCGVSIFFLIRDMRLHRDLYQKNNGEGEEDLTPPAVPTLFLTVMCLAMVGISVLFVAIYKENPLIFSIKRICLLCLLWPIAYIDCKTYRIPNAFLLLGLLYRAVLLGIELLLYGQELAPTLISEAVAAGGLFAASLLCTLVIKNSIGFGDIKLFFVMGLMLGLEGILGAVFFSLVASFVFSVFLLLTKKKSKKDVIPFGPCILIGTYLSVFLSGM